MITPHEIGVGVAICTPIPFERKPDGTLRRANITIDWHRHRSSLMVPTNSAQCEIAVDGLEVGDARCRAVELLTKLPRVPEFLFFIDYDVLIQHDALVKLMMRARHFPEYDIFGGVYCSKVDALPEPLIYKNDGEGPYWDWAVGDLLFDIASLHMGCTMIRSSLLIKMLENEGDEPLFKSTHEQEVDERGGLKVRRGSEDIYFCQKAREKYDAKIMVDTSILCAHQQISTGKSYGLLAGTFPIQRAHWLWKRAGGKPPHEELGLKKAVDIGAGGMRRHWDGYYTYTLDIRDEEGVDYVQDVRKLNLPPAEFDMVASSHFLEHMGRWDQDDVWDEMYKILKPGGVMEHIVPNIKWAFEHGANGVYDEHVYNVLYGAQEAHGYARELNTHYFGYVPEIAYAQCQRLGMVDIEVITHHNDPNLKYNMIIRAKKPPEVVDEPTAGVAVIPEELSIRVTESEDETMVKKTAKTKSAVKKGTTTKKKAAPKKKATKKAAPKKKAAVKKRATTKRAAKKRTPRKSAKK